MVCNFGFFYIFAYYLRFLQGNGDIYTTDFFINP